MAERIEAMFRVDGHRALVTGASSGLGRRFAASLDVTDPASIVACFDEIERRTGGPADSVVNKAGVTVTKSVLMQCEKKLRARIPTRRFGELSDLDGPLLLLASDAGAHMTGSLLAVDGGHLVSSL